MPSPENEEVLIDTTLTATDQEWLALYGVDASWLEVPKITTGLNHIISVGSLNIDPNDNSARYLIIAARKLFLRDFVGISPKTVEYHKADRRYTSVPLDRFIQTQRTMFNVGLNAAKVVHNYMPAISLEPETVAKKVDFITRYAKVLGWGDEEKAIELINAYPALLGFSLKKLAILSRIAATFVSQEAGQPTFSNISSALVVPLEKYLTESSNIVDDKGEVTLLPLTTLASRARKHKLAANARREEALHIAQSGQLGRIGTMYLKYVQESKRGNK